MKDAEYIRREYNIRFRGPASRWSSEEINGCRRLASRIIRWSGMRGLKGLRMLDVGCALGYYTKAFYLNGFESYGLDYSDVAIERASQLHPECRFIHADGLNPRLDTGFDLILCRGFSGANTHNIAYVAKWSDKYLEMLNKKGKFIFSYTSNFTGKESGDETVNWSKKEISEYIKLIRAQFSGIRYYNRYYFVSELLTGLSNFLKREKAKRYFYIIFTKL